MTEQRQLPDRDHGWGEPQELDQYGLPVATPLERARFPDGTFLHKGTCAIVLDGIEEYLDERADRVLDVPTAYSRFDDFDTYLGAPSAGAGSNHVGYGIPSHLLEKAVRFAAGPGRFSSDDLTVTACGGDPFVVQYRDHSYIVATTTIRGPGLSGKPLPSEGEVPDDWDPETHDVAGFDIVEDDEEIRLVLGRVFDHVDQFPVEVTGYVGLREGKHVFETASGRDLYMKGFHLKKLSGLTDPEQFEGEHTLEIGGEEYTVSWDEVEYDIGDLYDDWYLDDTGVVAAYQIKYEDPRRSSRVSMTGKITVDAVYKVLRFVDNSDHERRSYDEIEVREEKERLGNFDAEGWSPIGSNL